MAAKSEIKIKLVIFKMNLLIYGNKLINTKFLVKKNNYKVNGC